MGRPGRGGPPGNGPPGNGPLGDGDGPPVDDTIIGLQQLLIDLWREQFGRGNSDPRINVFSNATGGVFANISTGGSFLVKRALIQNISVEDVTITTNQNGALGVGIVLNAAGAAGEAGGSMPVANIDLAKLWFSRTTAGVSVAVYYEQ